jgi:hypothetical protein
MLWAVAAPAAAAPDGYACSSDAFTNIGGLHGVGIGEVTLRADPQFRSTGAEFIYRVRDRSPSGAGYSRISATWNVAGGRAGGLSTTQAIWLPFRGGLVSPPASIAISLDEGPSLSIPIADSWLQKDALGSLLALRIPPEAAPQLRGHRSFGYKVRAEDGTDLRSDLLLMPDWKKVPRQIDAALEHARSMLPEKTKCGSFIILSRGNG